MREDAPQLLIFEPYSETQIAEIIRDRLRSVRASPVSLDAGAVELCARKIALENGDARRALNVIRSANKPTPGDRVCSLCAPTD